MKELWFEIQSPREEQFRRKEKSRRARRPGLLLLLMIAALALIYNRRGPIVNLSPLALDFGTIADNAAADQSIAVANPGPLVVNLISAVVSGPNSADFRVISNGCPTRLVPGDSCLITVRFLPAAVAATPTSRSAFLDVADDAFDTPQNIPLKGTGTPRDDLAITPSPVDFKDREAATTSAPQQVKIHNTAGFQLALRSIDLTDDTNSEFILDRGECLNAPLRPRGTCVVTVSFSPKVATPVTATLTVIDETGDGPHKVRLEGTGRPPGVSHLEIDPPDPVDFGTQNVNVPGPTLKIKLISTGTKDLYIGQIDLGGAQKGDFSIANDGCSRKTMAPKSDCAVLVSFHPLAGGVRQANLVVSDNAGENPHLVSLIGTGSIPAQLDVSPSSLWFPESKSLPVTLTSSGSAPVTIARISVSGPGADDFRTMHKCPKSLPPGETCIVQVTFRPQSPGSRNATLSIVEGSPDATSHTVPLAGTSKSPEFAAADVKPPILTFTPESSSQMQTVTVRSAGTAPLDIGTIGVDPPSANYFSIVKDSCSGHILLPSSSPCLFGVVFRPPYTYARIMDARMPREFTADVVIPGNTSRPPDRVHLHAVTAIPPPPEVNFDVQPRELRFRQVVDAPGKEQAVTIVNNGTAPLALSTIRLQPGPFVRGVATCDLSAIEPRQPCRLPIAFLPKSSGHYSAVLEIGAGGRTFDVTLTGDASERVVPPPPPPVAGWCCYKGTLVQASPGGCDAGSPVYTDARIARRLCSLHIAPVRPNPNLIREYVPPPPPIR
jgi:hypothetical protein